MGLQLPCKLTVQTTDSASTADLLQLAAFSSPQASQWQKVTACVWQQMTAQEGQKCTAAAQAAAAGGEELGYPAPPQPPGGTALAALHLSPLVPQGHHEPTLIAAAAA